MACNSVASWAEPSKRQSSLEVVSLDLASILACLHNSLQGQLSVIVDNVLSTSSQTHHQHYKNQNWELCWTFQIWHNNWHIVGCPNLFCKLTNKLKAFMDSTINLLHVQVAHMLAVVFWDSIGKKFGRLPNFVRFPQTIWSLDWLGLTNLGQNAKK